jgi:phage-related minor tail protein
MAEAQHRVAIRMAMDGALEVKQGLREVGDIGNREMGKLAQGAQVAQRAFSLLGPVLAGISVGALAAFTKNAIDAVGGLGELADQLGVSTDALQALSLASTQAGISGEELQRGLAALTRKIADAATGEQTAATAFQRLGVAFQDAEGKARPTEAVLTDLAEKLKDIENPAERAAVATAMFGDRIGQKLIPLLSQGREGLVAMTAEALRFGTIASPELIAKADEAADKVAALTAGFTAFANNMLANVAPAISSVIDGLNRLIFGMTIAERRAQLEGALSASERRIEALQNNSTGISPGRRGSIRSGLVGAAQSQTGESLESLLAEERQRLAEIQREIEALNQQEEALRQRAEQILSPESRGGVRGTARTTVTAQAPRTAAPGRDPFAETLREQQSLLRANETAYERYQRQLVELAELQDRLTEAEQRGVEVNGVRVRALNTEELARSTARFATELERAERQTKETDLMGRQMGMTFTSAFEDAILKGKRFSDILKAVEQDIARIILRQTITAPLGNAIASGVSSGVNYMIGSFSGSSTGVQTSSPGVSSTASGPLYSANGNAFIGGNLIPFANGGVVSSPTMFPMARGMGVMGEAGPEAIMPLERGTDGRLGVRAQGGGQGGVVINQSITIDARGADPAVDQKIRAAIAIATEQAQVAFLEKINRGGNVAKAVGRR